MEDLLEKYKFRTSDNCDNCKHSGWEGDSGDSRWICKILKIEVSDSDVCDLYSV